MPGLWEWLFLGFLALLIFGPDRLPTMARGAGKTLARLRAEAASTMDELKRAADADEMRDVAQDLRRTGAELRQTSRELTASTSAAPAERSTDRRASSDVDRGPAPFDPDAT